MRGLDTGKCIMQYHECFYLISADVPSITKSIVNHVQTSLARQAYNLGMLILLFVTVFMRYADDLGAYQAAALSIRDNLLVGSLLLLTSALQSIRSTGMTLSSTTQRNLPRELTISPSSS